MKRDLDLARLILQKTEDCETPYGLRRAPKIDGYSSSQISYQIKLLSESGLVDGEDCSTTGIDGFQWDIRDLTWKGHDFLDASRDKKIWDKAKKTIINSSIAFTYDLLLDWLKTQIELP